MRTKIWPVSAFLTSVVMTMGFVPLPAHAADDWGTSSFAPEELVLEFEISSGNSEVCLPIADPSGLDIDWRVQDDNDDFLNSTDAVDGPTFITLDHDFANDFGGVTTDIRVSISEKAGSTATTLFGQAATDEADLISCASPHAKLTKIIQWGDWAKKWDYAFYGEDHIEEIPNQPMGSNPTSLKGMFKSSDFNLPIGNWDTSEVTDMSKMFEGTTSFNQDISTWNTANVTDMSYMFADANSFNQDINYDSVNGYWDTSKVIDMSGMFSDSGNGTAFNSAIGLWDTSSVEKMDRMFLSNSSFNQPIGSWDTSSVNSMQFMFADSNFNQPIGSWDVSLVTNMFNMFLLASAFDQPVGEWDVSSVENFNQAFASATSFNQYLGDWDTSSAAANNDVADFENIFDGASSYTFCLPDSFFPEIDGTQTDYETIGLASSFGDSCETFSPPAPPEPEETQESEEPTPAPPYSGPLVTGSEKTVQSEFSPEGNQTLVITGKRLETVSGVTIEGLEAELLNVTANSFEIAIPESLEAGTYDLLINSAIGNLTYLDALTIAKPAAAETKPTKKVNAGSFKGYIAVYTLGYDGAKLSAKIGEDWLIVDALDGRYVRTIEPVRWVNHSIQVRIYIDGELKRTIPLITR